MAIRADRVGVRQDQVDIHGRVTSPSFLNEILEDLPEWTDMPVWVNGTEELLPSNNSVPVTSPILTDIAYPDIRRDNQYFTYRESPTPVDGLAKIKSIKGNTLVWNQLVQNGNFATNADWITPFPQNGTLSIANNEATLTLTVNPSSNADLVLRRNGITYTQGHKYLLSAEFYLPKATDVRYEIGGGGWGANVNVSQTNTWVRAPLIITRELAPTATVLTIYPNIYRGGYVSGDSYKIRNVMVIDLTQMGLDSLTAEEFASLFPLSYYSYNQGSLLSFNGNGIKTVGKNQSQLVSMSTISGGFINASSGDIATVKKGITYTLSFDNLTSSTSNVVARILVDGAWKQQGFRNLVANSRWTLTFTATDDGALGLSAGLGSQYSEVKVFDNIQLEIGTTATSYEPYTSSTSSLPISTYFPNGMKSAGNVYDELTPRKAITRIGAVDLGSLTWNYNSTNAYFTTNEISSLYKVPSSNITVANIIDSKHTSISANDLVSGGQLGIAIRSNGTLIVKDTNYTDATSFKTAMSGVYFYYELATPVELPTMSFE